MIPPWLFNIHMDGVVREVNVRMLGKDISLGNADDREGKKNQLVLVADSEEKLSVGKRIWTSV